MGINTKVRLYYFCYLSWLVSTGIAWLLRFRILINNGLIFQSQVSYLIPIFGTILGYVFLKELVTLKLFISLIAVCIGIYIVREAGYKKSTSVVRKP